MTYEIHNLNIKYTYVGCLMWLTDISRLNNNALVVECVEFSFSNDSLF